MTKRKFRVGDRVRNTNPASPRFGKVGVIVGKKGNDWSVFFYSSNSNFPCRPHLLEKMEEYR